LHDVAGELQVTNYGRIKKYLLFLPSAILVEWGLNTLIIRAHMGEETVALMISPLAGFLVSFLGNFVPNFVTFSFAVVLGICSYVFDRLNEAIESCLGKSSTSYRSMTGIGGYPMDVEMKLAHFRQLHEQLCNAVRFLVKACELQVSTQRTFIYQNHHI